MGNYIVVLLVRKMNEGIFRNLLEIRKNHISEVPTKSKEIYPYEFSLYRT